MAEHRGVYGFWHQDGLLVCVRKARGPCTGLLDLPGGSAEAGEGLEQTLARELREECGVRLVSRGPWSPLDLHVIRTATGEPTDLHHRGCVTRVVVDGPVRDVRDLEDVTAVELVDVARVPASELSPVVHHALLQDGWGWRG